MRKQSTLHRRLAWIVFALLCAAVVWAGSGLYARFPVARAAESARAALPQPDATNVNLLELPDYANAVSTLVSATPASNVAASGTNFTVQTATNANYFIGNEYIDSGEFYRTDIEEYSDGSDISFLIEADVTATGYVSSVADWNGLGIIIGETQFGGVSIRLMKNGTVYLGEFRKTDNQTLYDHIDYEIGGYNFTQNTTAHLAVYYLAGSITVCVNGAPVNGITDVPVTMTPQLGIHAANAMGTVNNFSLRFIPPVEVPAAEPASAETAMFSFADGKLGGGKADTAISGDIASFTVTAGGTENYWPMRSAASDCEKLYIMTGAETAKEVNNTDMTTCIAADLKDVLLTDGGHILLVLRQGGGRVRLQLRIDAEKAYVQTATNSSAVTVGEGDLPAHAGTLSVRAICGAENTSVYVNDVLVIRDASYAANYANQIGFGGKNAQYTVQGLSYKYYEDVRTEAPVKETFPHRPPAGDANTEYIAPSLPQPKPTEESGKKENGENGCGSTVSAVSVAASVCVLTCAGLAIIAKRRKENEDIR